ncbi:MAG: hypothetical protein WCA63_03490 [Gallionella sp.]
MENPFIDDEEDTMKQIISGIMVGALLVSSLPALADRGGGHWEGHEIHRFGDRDLHIWRGGHWHNGRHGGRLGWWWIVGGVWYFYPQPVYPYPDPYTPSVTVINQQPAVVVPQTNTPVPVQPQQAAQLYYYCDSAKGYYPYVPNCTEGWRAVPAQPSQAAPR